MSKKDYIKAIDGAERRFVHAPVSIETREENGVEVDKIEGRAAKYNSRTVIAGLFEEEVLPGAFDDVLNDDVRCLFNHDPNMILARSQNGKGTLELFLADDGLGYRYNTPDRTYAKDLDDAIRTGDVSQSSFGFEVKKDKWTQREGQLPLRQIEKFSRLHDVSPVTYPAYADATVGKRSLDVYNASKITVNDAQELENRAETLDVFEAQFMYNKNKSK